MAEHEYFIDTSAFIALIYEDDQYHDEAVQIQEELDRKRMRCVTTDYVLTEVYAFLVSRVGRFAADLFDQALQEEENLIIIFQGEEGFCKAQELFRQYEETGTFTRFLASSLLCHILPGFPVLRTQLVPSCATR